uniref:Ig-like domain-containing protein n=1 Tax=Hucho hucho TaxID=62062 RepID=A0A4W5P7M3_9TELE
MHLTNHPCSRKARGEYKMVELLVFLLLCNSYGTKSSEISQPAPFIAAKLGENVTVECHVTSNVDHMVWYKMTTGKKLQCVAKAEIFYKHVHYFDEFKDRRFTVLIETPKNCLTITATKPEDIGIYYCGFLRLNSVEFGAGTALMVKGAQLNSDTVVQQPPSESVQLGDSVTLNCTIHTKTCAGEHSVYWFRYGSGESRPGIIYTHGDRSDQCEKSSEAGSPTQSCVYNLHKRNLSLSDAGTYYCAVASCGEILFGDGTKMDIEVPEHDSPFDLSPTVLSLVVSNIVLGIVTLLLVWALCKTLNRDSRGRTDVPKSFGNQNQDSDVLNYAAVSFTPKNNSSSRRAREKTSREDAVYSDVRYLQQQ